MCFSSHKGLLAQEAYRNVSFLLSFRASLYLVGHNDTQWGCLHPPSKDCGVLLVFYGIAISHQYNLVIKGYT